MTRKLLKEPLFWLTATVYITWLACAPAYGQASRGIFIRQSCGTITNAVENETYCFHAGASTVQFTQGELHLFTGGSWVCKTCGSSDDQTIQEVFTQGRVATNLTDYANRAQFGNDTNQGFAVYSDGVISPARTTCVVAGVEDNCDKVIGLNSGYTFRIQDSDGDDAFSYTEGSGALAMQERSGNPSTPATGYWRYFFKSDGLYYIDDAGAVTGPLGAASDKSAHVYHDANQTISNATDTVLAFNSERHDTHTFHDNVTNNTRITIGSGAGAGKYIFGVNVRFAANADSNLRLVYVQLNGTTIIAQSRTEAINSASNGTVIPPFAMQYEFAVNDYIEVYVHQASGGDLAVTSSANYSPEFWIQKVGG